MANDYTTYSFNDVIATLNHPAYQPLSTTGQGLGEINIGYANDNTAHELAADGKVMISRIKANNGHFSLAMQQTSALHGALKGLFNYLDADLQATALWAAMSVHIITKNGGTDLLNMTGVSFQKRADQPFQQQGQLVTWNFMAANIQMLGSMLKVPATPAVISTTANIINSI